MKNSIFRLRNLKSFRLWHLSPFQLKFIELSRKCMRSDKKSVCGSLRVLFCYDCLSKESSNHQEEERRTKNTLKATFSISRLDFLWHRIFFLFYEACLICARVGEIRKYDDENGRVLLYFRSALSWRIFHYWVAERNFRVILVVFCQKSARILMTVWADFFPTYEGNRPTWLGNHGRSVMIRRTWNVLLLVVKRDQFTMYIISNHNTCVHIGKQFWFFFQSLKKKTHKVAKRKIPFSALFFLHQTLNTCQEAN